MLTITPMTLKAARAYVAANHRHRRAPVGGLFAIGLVSNGLPCGVVIVGRPVSRLLDDGATVEVTRLCTDGTWNACSMLYAAARRAARALGYGRLVTYTLETECGASCRAAGLRFAGYTRADHWHRPGRPREMQYTLERKLRWECELTAAHAPRTLEVTNDQCRPVS